MAKEGSIVNDSQGFIHRGHSKAGKSARDHHEFALNFRCLGITTRHPVWAWSAGEMQAGGRTYDPAGRVHLGVCGI